MMAVFNSFYTSNTQSILDSYTTDDGWYVRKWSDGYVEMERNIEFDYKSDTRIINAETGGSLLYHPGKENNIPYPLSLAVKYSEEVTFSCSTNIDHQLAWPACKNSGTLTQTGVWVIVFLNESYKLGVPTFTIRVTGRWK